MTTPRFNYTHNAWEGNKYELGRDIKTIAKLTKQHLKKRFPNCKFSVTIERYSGGQSLNIYLMEAPFEAVKYRKYRQWENGQEIWKESPFTGYSQINHHQFYREYDPDMTGEVLTPEAWHVLKEATTFAQKFNFDDSDSMIDYFHTNFYLHVNIGKWDKPFTRS